MSEFVSEVVPEYQFMCLQLAACIRRAERNWPGQESTNEMYWHVREQCAKIARDNGIRISELIRTMTYGVSQWDKNLDTLSEQYWDQVVHPTILVREVLET